MSQNVYSNKLENGKRQSGNKKKAIEYRITKTLKNSIEIIFTDLNLSLYI